MNRWYITAYEFFCVITISLIMGIGIGWIQGVLAFESMNLAKDGIIMGGLCAIIVGPFIYYFFLRNNLNIQNAANLIMLCSITGLVSALILGWISWMVTPLALLSGAMKIHEEARKKAKVNDVESHQ